MSTINPEIHVQLPQHRLRRVAATLMKAVRASSKHHPTSINPIRVVCISDTHNLRPSLPPGDILIHAGDLSEWGTFDEIQAQLTWLSEQPHQHKIIIAGNHDLLFDSDFLSAYPKYQDSDGRTKADLDFNSVIYLQNETITISIPERKTSLNIYGSPWTPQYGTSAFQHPRDQDVWSGKFPHNTDILITHGPPTHFPNFKPSAGCPYLRDEVARVKPKLMVFGHIHTARGEQTVTFDWAQSLYDDIVDGLRGWEAIPLLIIALIWSQILHVLGRPTSSTRMVNAAVVDGMKKDVALDAFVVDL